MPLTQFVTIDGMDVSPWVMGIDVDVVIPNTNQENFVQQADVTLSNVGGKFDGAFGGITFGPQSTIVIVLVSIEYERDLNNPNVYSQLVYAGVCQKVDFGYRTVKINAGTSDANANAYIKYDLQAHKGESTGKLVAEVLAMNNMEIGTIVIPQGLEKREWMFLRDQSSKGVLDALADWDGTENFVNESGQYDYVPPTIANIEPPFTGRMKTPLESESAIGFCTKVRVVGASFLNAQTDGSENLPSDTPQYETNQADLALILNNENGEGGEDAAADMMANYGEIRAPTFYVPELTTKDECQKRAIRLLARYITYWMRALPAVVGRTPHLRSKVSWQYPRLLGRGTWQMSTEFTGRAVRIKTNFSPKVGWVSYIEVQPFVLNSANQDAIYGSMENP
jgi:hypothetical protein